MFTADNRTNAYAGITRCDALIKVSDIRLANR